MKFYDSAENNALLEVSMDVLSFGKFYKFLCLLGVLLFSGSIAMLVEVTASYDKALMIRAENASKVGVAVSAYINKVNKAKKVVRDAINKNKNLTLIDIEMAKKYLQETEPLQDAANELASKYMLPDKVYKGIIDRYRWYMYFCLFGAVLGVVILLLGVWLWIKAERKY